MDLLSILEHTGSIERYAAGTVLFRERDSGDHMYVVIDGEVDIEVHGEVIETAGPGEVVGEMALIDSNLRSGTAVAKTDCRVVPVDQRRFLLMVQETPQFSLHVMTVLADRLRRMNERT